MHTHPRLHRSITWKLMRKASFHFPQINKALAMCVRARMRACPSQSPCEGLLGRGGWTAMSVVSAGMSNRASPQFNAHMRILARWRETDKRGERGKMAGEDALLWFTVPPPAPKPQPQSMSQVLVTVVWGWQEDGSGSRFNQTDMVPGSDLMTACNSHAKKCRQAV